jgi:pyruvate/2-oxoglutarate dehydrogenase complex dihydrolipoamide dehydrogenase (E3) component
MMASMGGPVVILGGGSTGEAAAGALRGFEPETPIMLVEAGLVGGECSYFACMPSKALLRPPEAIAAARLVPGAAEAVTGAIDVERAFWHRDQVTGGLDDSSQETWLADRGVELVRGRARVTGPGAVEVGDRTLAFERILVATGSVPTIPPIPGLADVDYWTNREATSTHEVPRRLIVIGGGPVGCELAQAFGRMGAAVTLVDVADRLMPRDHPDAGKLIADVLEGEGIELRLGAKIDKVEPGMRMHLGGGETLAADRILVATGRRPNVDALDLQAARIKHGPNGIAVNNRFRTSNRRVYAIGDVTGLPAFTHSASHQASLLIRHLLFRLPIKMNVDEIPRVTFTDPELAHVGLTDVQARARHGTIRVLRWPYHDNDRAQAERETRGHIKVVANTKGLILGATIVGAAAGEQITTWTLAVSQGLNIRALAEIVVPYPTYTEIGKRAAITFFTPRLTTTWVRRILNLLRWFG